MRVPALMLVATVLAVAAAAPAQAHENSPSGFESTVTSVRPALAGLEVRVVGGDDQLALVNDSGEEVVVKGYAAEPYLRFSPAGVFQNSRSPAVYLNAGRPVPEAADPRAEPSWTQVAKGNSYAWHERRIEWPTNTLPPSVEASPDERQRIFLWTVPLEAGGRPVTVAGMLEWVPGRGASPRWWLLGVLLGLAALGGIAALVLYVRRPAGPAPAAEGPRS
jgi:hypothetical protein